MDSTELRFHWQASVVQNAELIVCNVFVLVITQLTEVHVLDVNKLVVFIEGSSAVITARSVDGSILTEGYTATHCTFQLNGLVMVAVFSEHSQEVDL
ncbi:hypothetical protein D3C75_591560 [compost metagenome]